MSGSYRKLTIIYLNTFGILLRAFTLNVYRLHADLCDVKVVVNAAKQEAWLRELFILLISGLILARFLMCFLGIVSNTIAIFPLLTNSHGELLMPTIIVNAIDNVILNIYELLLGYFSMRYLQPQSMAVFAILVIKMTIKTICSISTLNAYSEMHTRLTEQQDEGPSLGGNDSSQEFVIANQNLS